jgi:hypothetical protein
MRSPRPVFACMRFLLSHFVVAVMLIIAGRDMGIKKLDEMLVDDDDDCVALTITVRPLRSLAIHLVHSPDLF